MSLLSVVVCAFTSKSSLLRRFSAFQQIQEVPDIQCNIWCHLTWTERLAFREVSASSNQMHRHQFPLECETICQFTLLSQRIRTIDPQKLVAFFSASKQCLQYIENRDPMFVEKIIVDITEGAPSFVEASRASILWLSLHGVCCPTFCRPTFDSRGNGLHSRYWPIVGNDGLVIPYEHNLNKLQQMFTLAQIEMDRTKSKYNRYTRFALVFLDSFLMSLDAMDANILSFEADHSVKMVRRLWNGIEYVEFISDFLLRPHLRDIHEQVPSAIRLILDDAIGINNSLNIDRLMLMVHHPRLFFNFHWIFFEMAMAPKWNDKTRAKCLEFIVHHELITWSIMEDRVNAYEAMYPAKTSIQYMWRYVRSRSRGLSMMSKASNPLSGKKRMGSIEVEKSISRNDACCMCM